MKNYIFITAFILLVFQSCYKEPDFTNFDYDTYNRIVGPLGGKINFYSNYGNDSENDVIVSLNFPEGALDSVLVFNMYQFEDYELVLQMENGFSEIGSKFLYFVPFYESEGYNERGQMDLGYHLSIEFNKPVTVIYNFLADEIVLSAENWQESELYNDYYKRTNRSFSLFRTKIPKLDEWGEDNNIYVNWNNQGYPDGYDRTDLYYIISGIWSSINEWGKGTVNLENWEQVSDFNINTSEKSVTFSIYNTDYIYVLSRIIYISPENIPFKITNSVEKLYPALEIERAAFNGKNFIVYLSDNSFATFNKNGDFLYLTNDHYSEADLPVQAKTYMDTNFPNDPVKKVIFLQGRDWSEYEILLRSGIKLFFDGDGVLTGSFQYGYDPADLPADAISYLQQNHQTEVITNVTFDNEDELNPKYIVYLSSDAKVYFNGVGSWIETLYYRIKEEELPEQISQYFSDNYPNTAYSEINYTIQPDQSYYEIILVDNNWFQFNENAELVELELANIDEDDLPSPVTDYIDTHFPNKELSSISFYLSTTDGETEEGYDIYFTDMLNIELDPSGTLLALYGQDQSHLPTLVRVFLATYFSDETLLNCSYEIDEITTDVAFENVYHNWDLFLSGDLWIGLDSDLKFIYMQDFEVLVSDLIAPIASYIQTNHAGQTVLELSRFFSTTTYNQLIYYIELSDYTELVFDMQGNLLDEFKSTKKHINKILKKKEISRKRTEIIERLKEGK